MKRLTISHISAASIRANRRTYLSLAVGIFLAVFLATAVTVCAYGVVKAGEQEIIRKVGYADCVLYDAHDVTDEALRDSGLFERVGKVYITACVKESDVYLGYMDETGAELLCRTCTEGRLPESPGEIAVEPLALERLRLEDGVGDTVTWTLTPIDGIEEERIFTIVGILSEQSGVYDKSSYLQTDDHKDFHWPSVLVSPDEPAFASGRAVIQRVMTYAPLTDFDRVSHHHSLQDGYVLQVSHTTGIVSWPSPEEDLLYALEKTVLLLILGVSLLLAVCIGISSAMESVLAAKTEEIGMLRAVGATRRQIRRIFSRDAWLLTAAALPVGLALGILTAWLFSRVMPERMLFSLSPWLLLPVIAVSGFCIFVSSFAPLQRASRQLPMGVLRDTAMLRRAKRFRSRTSFHASRLIAGRQLLVHPWRQLGATLMVMATLLCTAFVGECAYQIAEARAMGLIGPAFRLYQRNYIGGFFDFSATRQQSMLTAQDIAQLRALPEVDHVEVEFRSYANLVFNGETPVYFRALANRTLSELDGDSILTFSTLDDDVTGYLDFQPDDARPTGDDGASVLSAMEYERYEQMTAAMDAQGLEGKLLSIPVYVCTLDDVDLTVLEGKVDLAALDAGEQVLVNAPTAYLLDGSTIFDTWADAPTADKIENDAFHAGQTLTFVQLLNDADAELAQTVDGWRAAYAGMDRNDVSITVGAVLGSGVIYEAGIITTEKGAAALGLEMTEQQSVGVYLKGDMDEETEKNLTSRIERIAMRGDLSVWNMLEERRESAEVQNRSLLLFGGMVVLFFAVAVAMQMGNAGRRIRADRRGIGTLRAVGADEKALMGCYRLPMLLTAAIGTALSAALYLIYVAYWRFKGFNDYNPAVIVPAMLILGVLCALCCLAGLRFRLRSVLDASIVENIREL